MANNTYNPYDDAQKIYKFKQQYDDAKAKGDTGLMQNAANSAEWLRKRMTDNGYGDMANQLKGYNTAQTANYLKYYPTQGKSSFRDYLKGSKLVTEYGYTPKQIDKAIGWNNATKEITFNGMNVGKADTIVDGVSYFDNSFLDGVVDNIITHENLTPKASSTSSENIQKLLGVQFNDHGNMNKKYDELYDFGMNTNPLETETGKAIMADYNLKAMQGRDNAAASGAASNGGNVDSFAAANALKQQASLTAMGQQQAIAAQTQRINDVRGILGDMGAYQQGSYQGMQTSIGMQSDIEQRAFENQETAKMNDHQINLDMATVLGYEPKTWATENNQYFGKDGMLLNPSTDFGTIIKNAEEKLKTATDPEEIKRLNATINDATFARQFKVQNYPEYAKYADSVSGYSPRRTLEGEALVAQNELADKEVDYNYSLGVAKANGGSTGKTSDILSKTKVDAIVNGDGQITQEVADSYNHHYGTEYTVVDLENKRKTRIGDSYEAAIKYVDDQFLGDSGMGATGLSGLKSRFPNLTDYEMELIVDYVTAKYGDDDDVMTWAQKNTPIAHEGGVDVDRYMNELNEEFRSLNKGEGEYSAVVKNDDGTYEIADAESQFFILRIFGDDRLSDEQKSYLIYDCLGITIDQVEAAIYDKHYR